MGKLEHRHDFVYLFDVKDGNPNGDPDAGNAPRIDPETYHGLVTDVCLKRKIRNFVDLVKQSEPGFEIYVQERAVLNDRHARAYQALDLRPEDKRLPRDEKKAQAITAWMCQTYYDIRAMGAVMTTGVNCGQVRGPVQLTFARSIDPVFPMDLSITRLAVTNKADEAKEKTIARKQVVPYGLYRAHGFVSAPLAHKTGFSDSDLDLLWQALIHMFEHDRAAARGEMNARGLFVFKHDSSLGNAPASRLFDRIQIKRAHDDGESPPRQFDDYQITVDDTGVTRGVVMHQKI